jgi:hypothetical protein
MKCIMFIQHMRAANLNDFIDCPYIPVWSSLLVTEPAVILPIHQIAVLDIPAPPFCFL